VTATAPGRSHAGELVSAAALLGMGLGGFVDGILFHQILQWHHMLSGPLPPLDVIAIKVNMFWDGLFHAFTWAMTVAGLLLLWHAERRSVRRPTPLFAGGLLLGWGAFDLIEGLIDHQILGLHHVHPGHDQLAWDMGFLAVGVALIAAGGAAIVRGLHALKGLQGLHALRTTPDAPERSGPTPVGPA
jgi:uncharacterized membrane protein